MNGLSAQFRGRRGSFKLDAAIEATAGTVTALFGHSGSGKTSLLRAIAGLERFAGRCGLDGETWQDATRFVPTERRGVGYVFQEANLFPHLGVRQNLEFGLRRAGVAHDISFDAAVALLGLDRLLDRSPVNLSGGERQRVALGRALLGQPKLLLLDEPLSGLDTAAKEEILPYFEALGRQLTIPIVLVTHDMPEVERLADRLVLLRAGQVVAAGPVNEVLVATGAGLSQSRDAAAVLAGYVARPEPDGLVAIQVEGRVLLLAGGGGRAEGTPVRVRIAARDVSLVLKHPVGTSILNVLDVEIIAIEAAGEAEMVVRLGLGGQVLLCRITRRSARELGLTVGQKLFAQVKGVSLLAGGATH